jgi:hypothetical protein
MTASKALASVLRYRPGNAGVLTYYLHPMYVILLKV